MQRSRLTLALAVLAVAALSWTAPAPAQGATPPELLGQARAKLESGQVDQALALTEMATRDMWNHLGLKLSTAVLIKDDAKGYGLFNPRKDNVFPPQGEPIRIYLEVMGYKVSEPQPGLFAFGVRMDVAVINARGQIVWGKENLMEKSVASRRFVRELFIPLTLRMKSVPQGEYTIKLTAHDKQGGAPAEVRLPIQIKKEMSADS